MNPIIIILLIIISTGLLCSLHTTNEAMTKRRQTINHYVCIYAYYEKNMDYQNNLRVFLENGGIRPDVDYIFVLNGKCSVDIPDATNIKVITRKNQGYDFGAWSNALSTLERKYKRYIFINSSVNGPHRDDWLSPFMELFDDSPDVKLVGTSINIYTPIGSEPNVYPHVQSMFFILDHEALRFLLENTEVFNEQKLNTFTEIMQVVNNSEVRMSLALIENKWNINCILSKYRGLDYRNIKTDINPTSLTGDAYYPGAYFGSSIKKEDVIFYKSYRMQS